MFDDGVFPAIISEELERLKTLQMLRCLYETVDRDETLRRDNGRREMHKIMDALIDRVRDPETGLLDADLYPSRVELIQEKEKKFSMAEFVLRLAELINVESQRSLRERRIGASGSGRAPKRRSGGRSC